MVTPVNMHQPSKQRTRDAITKYAQVVSILLSGACRARTGFSC